MLYFILKKYHNFFQKNLFERIIAYILVSLLVAKLYSEVLLGQAVYYNPQISQWVFYLLLASDYLISLPKILNIRFSFNLMSAFGLLLFGMILQGLLVGAASRNPWFVVFNDTVPLLMIALNILRMQSSAENTKDIDFKSIMQFSGIISFFSSIISFMLFNAGFISKATLTINYVYLCIFCAGLLTQYSFRRIDYFYFMVVFSLGINQMNRTTLLFCLVIFGFSFLKLIIRSPVKGGLALFSGIIIGLATVVNLPQDSPTYQRIVGLQNIDFNKRTGSVGERQQEWDSVNKELAQQGPTRELVGLGFGGTYTMFTTFETIKNYGHAHYSWVWFKMRFGEIGFIYLIILSFVLLINVIKNFSSKYSDKMLISLLSFVSILYLLTYVNAVFLIGGIQFFKPITRRENDV